MQKNEIINVGIFHESLDMMSKEVGERVSVPHIHMRRTSNKKINVLPTNINVNGYLITRTHEKR